MADDEVKMIWVRALEGLNVRPNEHRVVARETDDRHPNGEALVFGPDPQQVADTSYIRQKIREGMIEETSEADAKKVQERRQKAAADALGSNQGALDAQLRVLATTQNQVSEQQQSLDAERAKLDADRQALDAERAAFEQQKTQAQKAK